MDTSLKELVAQLKLLGWELPFVLGDYRYYLITRVIPHQRQGLFRQNIITRQPEEVLITEYSLLIKEVIKHMESNSNGY